MYSLIIELFTQIHPFFVLFMKLTNMWFHNFNVSDYHYVFFPFLLVYSLDRVLGDLEYLYLLPLSRPRRAFKGKEPI